MNPHPLLRHRDGHHARVTFEELFFDLVYVFAVTQLSHQLLHHLSLEGLMEAVILWFAVWLGWQYTGWVTNWFDPETPHIRIMLFGVMLCGLVMASAIPQAFGARGLVFALAYVAMQLGRTAFVLAQLGPAHPLSANFRRMLGWLCISAVFWLAGGVMEGHMRAALWLVAVLCEYVSPMTGFALPGMGRSRTGDWTIEGGHLAERCQLFVIVALGETVLATGVPFAAAAQWDGWVLLALLSTFLGTLAMWWLYFGTSSHAATQRITGSADPGRLGAYFHYIHAVLVAGIIGTAVGNDLVQAHPHGSITLPQALALVLGPVVFLLGSAIYKKVVYGVVPLSHMLGALVLLALLAVATSLPMLVMGWLTTLVMLGVGVLESRLRGRSRLAH